MIINPGKSWNLSVRKCGNPGSEISEDDALNLSATIEVDTDNKRLLRLPCLQGDFDDKVP